MMGSGKTTVGRALARLSHRTFEDTDAMLQHRLGRSISQLFRIYGEETFREHETGILRSLEPGATVLSTGGGIVLREANWLEMRRLGVTIWLDASLDLLCARLERSRRKRPLLEVDDWRARLADLLESRRPLYAKADLRIEIVDEDEEDCAAGLYNLLVREP